VPGWGELQSYARRGGWKDVREGVKGPGGVCGVSRRRVRRDFGQPVFPNRKKKKKKRRQTATWGGAGMGPGVQQRGGVKPVEGRSYPQRGTLAI